MQRQLYISMLRQGNNGNQILSILDAIASDNVSQETAPQGLQRPNPTLQEIEF